jgi:hypothetical protein
MMKPGGVRMRFLALSISLVLACASAQGQLTLPTLEQQANEAKIRQMQHEIEMARIQAQTNTIRTQTELMRLPMEQREAERANRPREKTLYEIMGEYQEKKAADAAAAAAESAREEEAARAVARSADTVYLGLAVALPLAFGFLIARRAKAAGGTMKYEEKFGAMLMIASLLLGLLALSISEDWAPRLDAMQNLMLTLKIRMFPESESLYSSAMVDVFTKHVLLGLVTVAAYGFTTYLGITPAWKKGETPPATPAEAIEPPKEA